MTDLLECINHTSSYLLAIVYSNKSFITNNYYTRHTHSVNASCSYQESVLLFANSYTCELAIQI